MLIRKLKGVKELCAEYLSIIRGYIDDERES